MLRPLLMFTNEDALERVIGMINVVSTNGNGSIHDINLIDGRAFAVFIAVAPHALLDKLHHEGGKWSVGVLNAFFRCATTA